MTTENNILIAEFIGAKKCKDWQNVDAYEHEFFNHFEWSNRFQDNLEINTYKASELQFDSDWNWLMQVIGKIEKLGYWTEIRNHNINEVTTTIGDLKDWNYTFPPTARVSGSNKLETTYKACVKFIELYNQNSLK